METPRLTSESSSDVAGKKETTKKKKKAETALGALVVEPKRNKGEDKVGVESFWRRSSKDETSPKHETEQEASKEAGEPSIDEQEKAQEAIDLPEIDAAEKQYAEQKLVQFKIEQANEDTDQIEEVKRFRQRIVEQGQDSDSALAVTLSEIEQQTSEEEISLADVEVDIEADTDTDGEDTAATTSAVTTSTPVAEASGGSGSNRPPRAPTANGVAEPPNGPPLPPRGSGYIPLFREPAIYKPDSGPASQPRRVEYIDNGNPAAVALISGITGYLIGRRRGRKQTEKKLLPIQKKLEKEVGELQWQLQAKESKIRQAVRQQQPIERLVEVPTLTHIRPARQPLIYKTPEQSGRRPAPEATQLHGKKNAPEQIGHMLVAAQAIENKPVRSIKPESVIDRGAQTVEKLQASDILNEKNFKTLNRAELLTLSDRIIIDGSSLRQIYETHLVGERGLRRLVIAYMRGGDLKKSLREEIVEREIDFERDPTMRDSRSASTYLEPAGTAAPALQKLLQKVDANNNTEKEEVAFLKARADYETKAQVEQQKHRHLVDATLGTTILILVLLVAVLVLTRH